MVVRSFAVLCLGLFTACSGGEPAAPTPAPGQAPAEAPVAAEAPPAGEAGEAPATAGAALGTEVDKTLYALGLTIGQSLAPFALTPAEIDRVVLGVKDACAGNPPQVDLQVYGPKIRGLAESRGEVVAKAEREKGDAFLATLAATPGAVRTPSGLVYLETAAGTGPSPTPADRVSVHYRGTLIDGTEFDSSYARNAPAEFGLGEVVPCWTEGVGKMKVGGKAKLGCPSALAYGDGGMGQIPGGAALLFEVELLGIVR